MMYDVFFLLLTFYFLPLTCPKGNTSKILSLKSKMKMKISRDTWMRIWQVVAAMVTAAITALTTTSCMGHGPLF